MATKWKTLGRDKRPSLKAGWYPAKLVSISEEETKYGESLILTFSVDGDEQGRICCRTYSKPVLFPGNDQLQPSNLYRAACALLKKDLKEDDLVPENELTSKYCSVLVDWKESQQGRNYQTILEFKPLLDEHKAVDANFV